MRCFVMTSALNRLLLPSLVEWPSRLVVLTFVPINEALETDSEYQESICKCRIRSLFSTLDFNKLGYYDVEPVAVGIYSENLLPQKHS